MVYYFTSNVVDPPATIYVGKDKFESLLLLSSFLFPFLFLSHPILWWSGVALTACGTELDWMEKEEKKKNALLAEIFIVYLF